MCTNTSLITNTIIAKPKTPKRTKVPNLPALDFLARSHTIKNIKIINPPPQIYIAQVSNCSRFINDYAQKIEKMNWGGIVAKKTKSRCSSGFSGLGWTFAPNLARVFVTVLLQVLNYKCSISSGTASNKSAINP